jgi:hypothetical protein
MHLARIVAGAAFLAMAGGLVYWLSDQQIGEKPVPEDPLLSFDDLGHPPETNPFPRPTAAPFPKIEATDTTFDFGVIAFQPNKADYENNSHAFVVKNVGEGPLRLAKGPTNCQCTMSTLSDLELLPGESTTISLTWEPTMVLEEFVKEATIWTNDPALFDANKDKPGQLLLQIKGKVVSGVELMPSNFSIGTINESEPTTLTAVVGSRVRADLEVTVKSISTPHLTVDLVRLTPEQLAERGMLAGFDVQATLFPRVSIGRVRESIVLTSNDPQFQEMTITVEGQRQGPVTIAGRYWNGNVGLLDFETFPAAKGAQTILSIYSEAADEPFQLELIEATSPDLEISIERDDEFPEEGREHHRMTVRIPPDLPPNRLVGADALRVRLKTNREDLPELKFRVIYESR